MAPDDLRKKYHVIAKLGEGGMALVHLAVVGGVAGVRKLAVLKSIRPQLVTDPQVREMFLAEARLAATLNHPNIVQTFEVVVLRGRPVIVMEYMDGQPLSRILRDGRRAQVPLSLQLLVIRETLTGLEYVHSATDLDGSPLHLVHRDVSPQNIFVAYDGNTKLLDFGIAKKLGSAGDTETGVIKGKIRYMSPEQLTGEPLDGRADLFSVGVILWEALTAQRMWEGLSDVTVIRSLAEERIPAPSSVAQGVPPLLEAICVRALAPNCADRYESAAAMQADLDHAIAELELGTNSREVGKFVAEAFRELRTTTKKVIEDQLKDESAAAVNLVVDDDGELLVAEDGVSAVDFLSLTGPVQSRSQPVRRPQTARIGFAMGGSAVVAAGLGWLLHSHPAARGAMPPAMASSAESAVSRSVVLDAGPETNPGADALAAHAAASAPSALSNPTAREGGHDAPGHKQHGASASPTPVGGSAAVRAAANAPAPASASCDPPFYFDDKGIKHVKPECL